MHLESDRLLFDKFQNHHAELYHQLVAQDNVMEFITGKGLNPSEASDRFQTALAADQGYEKRGFLAVTEKASGAFIGLGKLVPYENGSTEVGYALDPSYWGKGYASEIMQVLVDYARQLGTIEELLGVVNLDNIGSVRVLTKHGFSFQAMKEMQPPVAYYVLKLV